MSKVEKANHYADMIIHESMSIREVAKAVGVSKSTVYLYVKKYTSGFLRKLRLYVQLKKNTENWWYKGGKARATKYRNIK